MKVEKKILCRGEAKIFLLLVFTECGVVPKESNLCIVSKTTEGSLPLEWTCAASISSNGTFEAICMVPQNRKNQKIVATLCDDSGRIVSEFCFNIDSKKSSIESKLFGVKDPDECQLIRNIDNLRNMNQYDMKIDDISYVLDNEWLLHFSIDIEVLNAKNLKGYCWAEVPLAKPQESILAPQIICDGTKRAHFVAFFSGYISRISFGVFDEASNDWYAFDAIEYTSFKSIKRVFLQRHLSAWLDPNYGIWFKNRRASAGLLNRQKNTTFNYNPLFSIIVPLYKTPINFFIEMTESVIRQSYPNWELIFINASPEDANLYQIAEEYSRQNEKIIHRVIAKNLGITENTNIGIGLSKGDYLCFFDHDDVLEPDILFEYARAINCDPEIDLLYCDEDKLLPNGALSQPTFKPDFNLDLLRDNNYICHMLTVKHDLHSQLDKAGANVDGAQDYSLTLQMAEEGAKFYHVPKILYHWRISANSTAANSGSKPYATQAGILALQNHLDRMGLSAVAENSHGRDFRYKVNYSYETTAISLIVMPIKENKCSLFHLKKISQTLSGYDYEIVVVTEDGNAAYLDSDLPLVVVSCGMAESFIGKLKAALNHCSHENLFVLSGDYCFEQEDWVDTTLGHLQRQEVAVVSPMICDVAGMIREAGRTYLPTTFVPLSKGTFKEAPGYIYRPLSTQNVSLINSSCFATKKSVLKKYASFDSDFGGDCFVADLCFECSKNKLLAVYTPEITAIQFCEFHKVDSMDVRFLNKWASKLSSPDPFFNPNFARDPYWASQYALCDINAKG